LREDVVAKKLIAASALGDGERESSIDDAKREKC